MPQSYVIVTAAVAIDGIGESRVVRVVPMALVDPRTTAGHNRFVAFRARTVLRLCEVTGYDPFLVTLSDRIAEY